jgi:hypothetical protein
LIKNPQGGAARHFVKLQQSAQKDIEQAFGVLQACWACLKVGCQLWEKDKVMDMIICCIILHNMIVEERSPDDIFLVNPSAVIIPNHCDPTLAHTWGTYLQNISNLHNCVTHAQLREDLKIYNWLL